MTFEQYLIELRRDVEHFEVYWRDNNAAMPEEFPMDMEAGDWDEQFLLSRGV